MTTVKLSHPVDHHPHVYADLTFRKIKLGDMPAVIRAGSLADLDDIVSLVARLADVPLEVACAIDPEDIAPVLTAMTAHISQHMPKSI